MENTAFKYELTDIEPCVKKISFEVSPEKMEEEKEKAFKELGKQANVPGFRKGHIPRKMLEKMYGKSVTGDVANKLIEQAYREALETHNINPTGEPMVDDINIDDDKKSFTFSATVECFPNVTLKDVAEVKIARQVAEVKESEIDEVVAQYREHHARFEPVDRDTVQEGDYPIIDYSAKKEDGSDIEHFKGENKQIQVVKGDMLDAFHEGVIGMKNGEEKEFQAKMGKDFPIQELTEKNVTFKVKVHEIKQRIVPEMDDDLVKEVSSFDTVAEFRADLREKMEQRNQGMADNDLKQGVMAKLIEANPFDLPGKTLTKQAEAIAKREEQQLATDGGPQSGAPKVNMDKCMEQAERMLREEVIMASFAKDQNIQLTKEDVEAELKKVAKSMGQSSSTLMEQLQQGGQGMDALTHQAFTEKTMGVLLEKITLEDESVEEIHA